MWEGFIRCCQKMKPQSFTVLLQLRAPQLKSVFESCPDLKEPLLAHVNSFAPNQVHSSCFSSAHILFLHFRIIGYIRICLIKMTFVESQKAHLPKTVLAILESPPEVLATPPQAEVPQVAPTITPVMPAALPPPVVTSVKVEDSVPVPMETQTIQTVQSIQTIGSNLVQVNLQSVSFLIYWHVNSLIE